MALINMENMIEKLRNKRKLFASEADFQLELAWVIKESYPNSRVRLEYSPRFDLNMHIDILVIINNQWVPIELKYKTKGGKNEKTAVVVVDNETYSLKNQSAKDTGCYLYLRDIRRIESIKENAPQFAEGYTVFITNDLSYTEKPRKANCVYKEFSLEQGIVKTGRLNWADHTGAGTKKSMEKPIILKGEYKMDWKDYSDIENTEHPNISIFKYLINEIK